jgi:hypothetical protein
MKLSLRNGKMHPLGISEKFSADVDFVMDTYKNENFFEALDEIGDRFAKRGLTEEIVNEILNSDD